MMEASIPDQVAREEVTIALGEPFSRILDLGMVRVLLRPATRKLRRG